MRNTNKKYSFKMKKLFTLLLILVSFKTMSQPLFGYTPSEIRAEHPDADWLYDKWGEPKNMLAMSYKTDGALISYLFNDDNKSMFTIITIYQQGLLQAFIEKYNSRYVIINDYTWRLYKDDSIYECYLKRADNGNYFFMWSIK